MTQIFATVPKTDLKLFLFPDEISPAIEKKLTSLGWPELYLKFSLDKNLKMEGLGDGKFKYIAGEFGASIPLIAPTDRGAFSATYNPADNSIDYQFEGEFLVFGWTDEDSAETYKKITKGYISGLRVADAKGKNIKKPKDEYGMALPLEVTILPGEYGDVYLQVSLTVEAREE
jgi:hypothetical protein